MTSRPVPTSRLAAVRVAAKAACGVLLVALAGGLIGCLQVDTHIALHPDGSATVTERLRFSRELLELDDRAGADLASLLDRAAAADRMKHMGQGVTLVSHEVRDAEKGSRESVAVFRVPDMAGFTYVSPFLPQGGIGRAVGLKADFHAPLRDGSSWEHIAGWLGVRFQPQYDPAEMRRIAQAAATQPDVEPTPLQLQMVRELRPVFGDLMRDFRIKVTFESYAPVLRASFGWRDARSATHLVDLIDFDPSRNSDMYGFPFVENEEIMLDLLRWRLDSPTLADHIKGWTQNQTLPVLHRGGTIYFKPSRELFARFFEGKTLTHHRTGETPARFEEIGYEPAPTKLAPTTPDSPRPQPAEPAPAKADSPRPQPARTGPTTRPDAEVSEGA